MEDAKPALVETLLNHAATEVVEEFMRAGVASNDEAAIVYCDDELIVRTKRVRLYDPSPSTPRGD